MKKIMILGGAHTQVPLAISARDAGYQVILCDYAQDNAAQEYAHKFYQVSTTDRDALLKIAREEKIDGVVSNSERAMVVVAWLSQQLGLVGNTVESIERLNAKDLFRDVQKRAGVFYPKHIRATEEAAFLAKAEQLAPPFIIKPCECSGTRGTTKMTEYDATAVQQAFRVCSKFSRNGAVAAEEYIEMPSLTVMEGDIFVHKQQILWDGLFYTQRSKEAPMVPMTYCLPLMPTDEERTAIQKTLTNIINEAGITWGAYNVEMYFTKENQLFVIEINARQGGFRIPKLIRHNSGISMDRLLVTTAVGDDAYFEKVMHGEHENNFISQCVVFSHKDGVFQELHMDDEVLPYVTNVDLVKQKNDPVKKCENTEAAIGFVEMLFPDFETQHRVCENIEQHIYPMVL